jgi:hypothetical protein
MTLFLNRELIIAGSLSLTGGEWPHADEAVNRAGQGYPSSSGFDIATANLRAKLRADTPPPEVLPYADALFDPSRAPAPRLVKTAAGGPASNAGQLAEDAETLFMSSDGNTEKINRATSLARKAVDAAAGNNPAHPNQAALLALANREAFPNWLGGLLSSNPAGAPQLQLMLNAIAKGSGTPGQQAFVLDAYTRADNAVLKAVAPQMAKAFVAVFYANYPQQQKQDIAQKFLRLLLEPNLSKVPEERLRLLKEFPQ